MDNYEYIIASLPSLSPDWKNSGSLDVDGMIARIQELSPDKDNALISILLEGFDDKSLGPETYEKALGSGNRFIRDYFSFDLFVRNAKVRYLNKALGRPADQDIFRDDIKEDPEGEKVTAAFQNTDILGRERAIDDLMWGRISEITTFDYFDIEAVLGYIAKLHIISRWLSLDEETGKEMFRKLISEVRGTFKGVGNTAVNN